MNFIRSGKTRIRSTFGRLRTHHSGRRGNAAIEFALVTPIFAVILAGGLDLAMLVFSRFRLEAAVSNSASYALVQADMVDAKNSSDLAEKLAVMIASEDAGGNKHASIVVNNGASADYNGTKISIRGMPGRGDACYCPSGSAASLVWGSARTCASACPSGGKAGKFVVVTVKQAYTPLFSSLGIVKGDSIDASAVIRAK
ncbi:hypothetical protein SJ05684_b56740 (plasmid) [Sinorhizobium sojae CCBAU 05684]|uniref:TadE-like domain-containing protein n=1 Tax=Sinorhizobium sojae CCBAU 05684 TaxID=716928 RepID=A0A249PLI7_9HYPH|nr:TadE family protein [Sinorhizobium sojae]ASY66656.1 hypothetical protein SJ05684_b56740 [Sinorhizobium sojae CCBAU 05684]